MPANGSPRDEVLRLVDRTQAAQMRREETLVQAITRAYEAARRDLLTTVSDAFSALGPDPAPEDIRRLAGQVALMRAIERRLAELEAEFADAVRTGLGEVGREGFAAAAAEIEVLARDLGVNGFQFALDPLLELTIGPAIEQIPGLSAGLRANILASLRESLAAGDRFSDIARAVLAKENSVFRNGFTSAELMARRAVVQANNNAKLLFYEQAKQQVPGLQKQALAAVGSRTTRTCLAVHGQIRKLDEPFELTERPRFGRRQMQPPFHWNCRTTVAPYLARYEVTSGLTTADMRAAAQKELAGR